MFVGVGQASHVSVTNPNITVSTQLMDELPNHLVKISLSACDRDPIDDGIEEDSLRNTNGEGHGAGCMTSIAFNRISINGLSTFLQAVSYEVQNNRLPGVIRSNKEVEALKARYPLLLRSNAPIEFQR